MKKCFLILFIGFLFYGCSSEKIDQPRTQLDILEVNPSKWTALVKQNLLHLTQIYDLSPFLYTSTIRVQTQANSNSHPVLTINTQNAERPHKILSELLHEELHWWADLNRKKVDQAILDLKKIYTTLPVSNKKQHYQTYEHLVICYVQFKALSYYLGRKTASLIIVETMRKDKIYPWVYSKVLNNSETLEKTLAKHGLIPPILKPNKKTAAI